MKRYKSIPDIVEAEQYFKGKEIEGVYMSEGFKPSGHWSDRFSDERDDPTPYVITIHGQRAYIEDGDWVVKEPDGKHHYPVKDAIFRKKYIVKD